MASLAEPLVQKMTDVQPAAIGKGKGEGAGLVLSGKLGQAEDGQAGEVHTGLFIGREVATAAMTMPDEEILGSFGARLIFQGHRSLPVDEGANAVAETVQAADSPVADQLQPLVEQAYGKPGAESRPLQGGEKDGDWITLKIIHGQG